MATSGILFGDEKAVAWYRRIPAVALEDLKDFYRPRSSFRDLCARIYKQDAVFMPILESGELPF